MTSPIVFIGIPHSGVIATDALPGLMRASSSVMYGIERQGSSALTRNFNMLLLQCRQSNPHPTHFGLHHSDIVAQPGWLDILMGEMAKYDADVVSTVMPIKDERGFTTTGAFSDDFTKIKRFTMREIEALPETFTAPNGRALAVNTGLFVMRTDRPWFERLAFRFEDEIVERGGQQMVLCRSEDWLMSEFLAREGARVWATRKVKAYHVGQFAFPNQGGHGTEESEDPKWWR